MFNGSTFLAIIPARGGSKRLPKKNILELAGKPMIAWTIEAALQSKYIDDVVVTSDDLDIINVAEHYGASVPFIRPENLSDDKASSIDVVVHTVEYLLKHHNKVHDFIVLMQPTSPLRTAKHVDDAVLSMFKKEADAIISVTKMDHSPLWSNTLPEDKNMTGFITDEVKGERSQDLPAYFRLNGAIYICNTKKLLEERAFFLKENVYAFEMDRASSVDVDEALDFQVANYLAQQMN